MQKSSQSINKFKLCKIINFVEILHYNNRRFVIFLSTVSIFTIYTMMNVLGGVLPVEVESEAAGEAERRLGLTLHGAQKSRTRGDDHHWSKSCYEAL